MEGTQREREGNKARDPRTIDDTLYNPQHQHWIKFLCQGERHPEADTEQEHQVVIFIIATNPESEHCNETLRKQ